MTLDPDAAALLHLVRSAGRPSYHQLSPAEARDAMVQGRATLAPEPVAVGTVRELSAPGPQGPVALRLYQGGAASGAPALVYFHGGGWVIGSLETHDGLCRHLAAGAGCSVIAVDYRLAPEHKFPAAIDDGRDTLRWIIANADLLGIDPDRVAVGGDSAGANIAAVLSILARDGIVPPVCWQLLLYPSVDLGLSHESYDRVGDGFLLTTAAMAWFRGHYLNDEAEAADWRASPLRAADLSGVAPALVLTAGYDPLTDEGEAYAERLRASGVVVQRRHYPGQMHGFLTMGRVLPTAITALDELAAALNRALDA